MKIVDSTSIGKDNTSVKLDNGRHITEEPKTIRGFVSAVITRVNGDIITLCHNKENLLTEEGRDKMHEAVYKNATATQTAFNFIGLSTSATAPATTDTRTTWELIETSGNGLDRIQASTRNHTASTNTTTLIHEFTASAQVLNVQKAGVLDRIALATGFLGHENTFTLADLEIGDKIQITWVYTLG